MDKTSAQQQKQQPSSTGRMAVLDALRAPGEPATVHHLSMQTGLHANTVRFHLTKLVQLGLAVEEPGAPTGPGRPRLCYRPAQPTQATGDADRSSGEYRVLSQILSGYLAANSDDPDGAARSAGRQWAHHLVDQPALHDHPDDDEVLGRVTTMLDDLGFAPEARGSGEIQLHRCPFRDVADRYPGVVCSLHLGLLQGALDQLGGAAEETTLEPFVTPQLCVARVPMRRPGGARADTGPPQRSDSPPVPANRRRTP